MSHPPTVFIVDDDAAVLKGLARLLRSARLDVLAFGSPQEFLERHDPRAPGCLVLDLAMPGLNGLELQAALAKKGSTIPIIFLTGHGDIPTSVQAMKNGALDFLTKPVNDADLLKAVHTAIKKDRDARQARAELDDIQARLDSLTPREREVLTHVVAGHLNKQTAADLGTVEKTIKIHRARVMEKMKVESLAELVRLAERVGVEENGVKPAREDARPTNFNSATRQSL
jgi:FixJ family two-component response regulator